MLAPVLLVALASPPDVVLTDGQVVTGDVHARQLTVAEGATVTVAHGVTFHADSMRVEGTLIGSAGLWTGDPRALEGADLTLVVRKEIRVGPTGELVAGDAFDFPQDAAIGFHGSVGGDVVLRTPEVWNGGRIVGGAGGAAARGGAGGTGGMVVFHGELLEGSGDGPKLAIGGAGGEGGGGLQAGLFNGFVVEEAILPGAGGTGGGTRYVRDDDE